MYNIDKIEITIDNIFNTINVLIMPDTLKAFKDGKEISIDKDFIKSLLRIICLWNKQSNVNNVIDNPSYDIRIYYEGKMDRYSGNKKPRGFKELLELLGDLDE